MDRPDQAVLLEIPAQPERPQAAPAAQQGGAAPVMMEITTEMSGFSTSAIDPSKFEVPSGFKQIESQMLRGMRR